MQVMTSKGFPSGIADALCQRQNAPVLLLTESGKGKIWNKLWQDVWSFSNFADQDLVPVSNAMFRPKTLKTTWI